MTAIMTAPRVHACLTINSM